MGFGPYSQIVKPAEWVDPLNLDLYAKGMMYKQQLAEKNLQDITDTYKSIASLPAYGPDRKKLAEIDQQFRQQLSSMDISDLSDMRSTSQIRGLLGGYTTNADVLAIAQRGATYEKMMKEEEEAKKKNQLYMNPGKRKADKYFNGKDYIRDVTFRNDGYTFDGNDQIMKQVKSLVTPDKKVVNLGHGEYRIDESYDPEKLKTAFQSVLANNANWKRYHVDKVNESLEDINVDDYAKQYYGLITSQLKSNIDKINQLKALEKDPRNIAKYDLQLKQQENLIIDINKKIQNPYLGISFKQELAQKSIDDDIENMSEAIQFQAQGETRMKESTRLGIQFQHQIMGKQAEDLSLGASMMGMSLTEVIRNPSLYSQAILLGQEAKLAEFSKKEGVKLKNKLTAKNEAIRGGFGKFTDTDTITYTDEKGDTKTLQYGEFKKTLKEANSNDVKAMVAAVMNKKEEGNPEWQPITADDVSVTGTGEKRKFKINGFFGFGGDAIRYDEVIDISTFEGSSQAPSSLDEAAGLNPLDNAGK